MRLGVYADLVYRQDADGLSTDRAFVHFVTNLAAGVDRLVLFGRLQPEPGRSPYALPAEGVELVPLPHYGSVADVRGVVRSLRESRARFERELPGLDAVWLFGPHPLALSFARAARRRGVRVFLGVRQDFPAYVANRLPGRGWAWAIPVAHALERRYRRLARTAPTVVVGADLERTYAGGAPVLATGFSLIRAADVVDADTALARTPGPELRVLSVGRLDSEKNPLLLSEILATLRARDPRYRLVVAGDGPLADAVRARAAELGVADALSLRGYVPNGSALWGLYRESDVFLHVSLTEGLPQVLFEAQSLGVPVVATDVGGVAAALDGGRTGLLVPPRDAAAAAAAVDRLRTEPGLRERLVRAGLDAARRETLEAQGERVLAFFRANL